jgi:hypothetical protein
MLWNTRIPIMPTTAKLLTLPTLSDAASRDLITKVHIAIRGAFSFSPDQSTVVGTSIATRLLWREDRVPRALR